MAWSEGHAGGLARPLWMFGTGVGLQSQGLSWRKWQVSGGQGWFGEKVQVWLLDWCGTKLGSVADGVRAWPILESAVPGSGEFVVVVVTGLGVWQGHSEWSWWLACCF